MGVEKLGLRSGDLGLDSKVIFIAWGLEAMHRFGTTIRGSKYRLEDDTEGMGQRQKTDIAGGSVLFLTRGLLYW